MKKIIYAALIILLCAVLIGSIFNVIKIVNNNAHLKNNPDYVSRVINRDGVNYYPKQDIITFLFIGLDRTGIVQESESYNNTARADVVSVVTFDNTKKQINVLNSHLNIFLHFSR